MGPFDGLGPCMVPKVYADNLIFKWVGFGIHGSLCLVIG